MDWTLRTLVSAAGVEAEIRGDTDIGGIAYDPAAVSAGDVFCCIPGARLDGHDHAAHAVAAGAAALLVERFCDADAPQARVERVRSALGPLSDAFFGRPSQGLRIAGITGTNGKTTVTYLVEAMAEAAGRSAGLMGNVERRAAGRHWPTGLNTPESIDLHRVLAGMRDAGARIVAMEVTSDGLEQRRVDGTTFACVAFTNLTQDHLNTHGSMEAYFTAKRRLFTLDFAPVAVVNTGDPYGRVLTDGIRGMDVLTFGEAGADISADDAQVGTGGTSAVLRTPEGTVEMRSGLIGRHNVENLMCATGVALSLGLGLDAAAAGAARLAAVPGRMERVVEGQPFTVLVDYAHTPDALQRTLDACREIASGRVLVVFGCGGDRDRAKRPLMGEAATRRADLSVVTSDNPRSEDPTSIIGDIVSGAGEGGGRFVVEADRSTAIGLALAEARDGDIVLIAGKGHESGQILADRTIPFDDRDVASRLLSGSAAERSETAS